MANKLHVTSPVTGGDTLTAKERVVREGDRASDRGLRGRHHDRIVLATTGNAMVSKSPMRSGTASGWMWSSPPHRRAK
jgi:hypothetical protein